MTESDLDYRPLLREELLNRIKKNASYSARAMARDLNLSPAFFSQVLNSKRTLSEVSAQEIVEKVNWDGERSQLFLLLARYQLYQNPVVRKRILNDLKRLMGDSSDFYNLEVDKFHIVAGWQHFAILELSLVRGFKSNPKWIAAKLGISQLEVIEALDRLERVGLIKKEGKVFKKANPNYSVKDIPSKAIRTFHKEHLEKASRALEEQTFEERDFSGTTMAIDPANLPKAKEKIRRFRKELMELLEKGEKRSVYHVALQLYRLDKGDKL